MESDISGMFDPLRNERRVVFVGRFVGLKAGEAKAVADVLIVNCCLVETLELVVFKGMLSRQWPLGSIIRF
ncbi:hypothetical protein IMZ48_49400 [Candidatus Bathyarchaeota archaeon]|nr:hypothetical protein [Candidatus Bathyarchaeota archaeon]